MSPTHVDGHGFCFVPFCAFSPFQPQEPLILQGHPKTISFVKRHFVTPSLSQAEWVPALFASFLGLFLVSAPPPPPVSLVQVAEFRGDELGFSVPLGDAPDGMIRTHTPGSQPLSLLRSLPKGQVY